MIDEKPLMDLLVEFEEKFGFKAYESLKNLLGKQHFKIEELEKSREKWKNKLKEAKGGTE
jgi:hypothetical protein|tara:strand:+ start:1159 stop:1338 length:180 start_codon:yes stop_codon:yes gene_type:complete